MLNSLNRALPQAFRQTQIGNKHDVDDTRRQFRSLARPFGEFNLQTDVESVGRLLAGANEHSYVALKLRRFFCYGFSLPLQPHLRAPVFMKITRS